MILAVVVGLVLERGFGIPNAAVIAVLLGLVAAQFVPSREACALPPREDRPPHTPPR